MWWPTTWARSADISEAEWPAPGVELHEPHDEQRHVADEEVGAYVGLGGAVGRARAEVALHHPEGSSILQSPR